MAVLIQRGRSPEPSPDGNRELRQYRVVPRRRLAIAIMLAVLSASARAAGGQDARPFVIVVDRDMTPVAGTIDLLTVQRAFVAVEDRWLPPARFDESTRVKRGLGIGYRAGKWFALDLPQDHFLMVVGHEVFGHGARLREIGAHGVEYGFDAPIPYGAGGAVTEFSGDLLVTRTDALAIDTSGIEAQNVLAEHINREAVASGALHYREAWLYLESRLDGLRYIRSVSPRSSPGHDVRSFLLDFNDQCDPPACEPLDAATLKRRALVMLGDPMLAYAGYAWAAAYMVHGRTTGPVPTIPLPRDLRYLPAVRFEMTPYGTAVTTDHTIVRHGHLTNVSIGVGDTGAARAWDVGVTSGDVLRGRRLNAGASIRLWRQPELDAPPNAQVMKTGVLAAGTLRVALPEAVASGRAGVLVEAGYKSDGFVRGERLHAGPIVRAGVVIRRSHD